MNGASFFFKFYFTSSITCMCVSEFRHVYTYPQRPTEAQRGPEMLNTMKLELQEVVSCLIWVLGTELKKLQKSPKCHFTSGDFVILTV